MKFTVDAKPDELVSLLDGLFGMVAEQHARAAPVERATPSPQSVQHRERAALEAVSDDDTEPLAQEVKNLVHGELSHFLSDVEFRVAQAYDVERRGGNAPGEGPGKVYAEDLHLLRHQLTGYTVTANSPSNGSIAWASLHVVYNGTDYAITDGNTANKYVWWDPDVGGVGATTTTLQTGATKPDLSSKPKAALLFINNNGSPVDVLASTIPTAVADNAVDSGALASGAVSAGKIAAGAVNNANLFANGVVGAAAIGAQAVGTSALANGAVTSAQLGAKAVTTAALNDGAVTATQLGAKAVGTAALADAAVTAGQLGAQAVGTAALANGAVTSGQLGAKAVTTAALNDGAVGATQLGAAAVTAAKINVLQHLLY